MKEDSSIFETSLSESMARGVALVKALNALETEPRPFDLATQNDLLHVVGHIEMFASSIEPLLDDLRGPEMRMCLEGVAGLQSLWERIDDAVDHTVALAITGRLDRRYAGLSPIVNGVNLNEKAKLQRLRSALTERLCSAAGDDEARPDDADVADPDLSGIGIVQVSELGANPAPVGHDEGTNSPVRVYRSKELEDFADCLARLASTDELDRNQALMDVLHVHQQNLYARILRANDEDDAELSDYLRVISRHAEVVFLEDYFCSSGQKKLSRLLAESDNCETGSLFRELHTLFHQDGRNCTAPHEARARLVPYGSAAVESALRIMLFHSISEYRRFATAKLKPARFWSVTSNPNAPLVALADVAKRLVSDDVSEDYRRVFFDCTFKRMLEAECEVEVKMARSVINRYLRFDLCLEDGYFRRVLRLNELIERHEKVLGIEDASFQPSLNAFLEKKDRVGSKKTRLPTSLGEIPLEVQRRLSRAGVYLTVFIGHPNPKIALETVRFLDSSRKIEKALKMRQTNRYVVREIANNEKLLVPYSTRLALLSNPHTPLKKALKHLSAMRAEDLKQLAASRDTSPELRARLRDRLRGIVCRS